MPRHNLPREVILTFHECGELLEGGWCESCQVEVADSAETIEAQYRLVEIYEPAGGSESSESRRGGDSA
jgi:hypothetical protein